MSERRGGGEEWDEVEEDGSKSREEDEDMEI